MPVELLNLLIDLERFLLVQPFKIAARARLLLAQYMVDTPLNSGEVREGTPQPSIRHVRLSAATGFSLDRIPRLLLGANEEDLLAIGCHAAHEIEGEGEPADGLLKIDDVDTVPLRKDKRAHFRVPAAGLVAKVDARLQ